MLASTVAGDEGSRGHSDASTATTAGTANPVLSLLEDVFAIANAVLAILLSCIGKLAAAIQAVPVPVMGGVSLLLYGVIGASGIRVLIESKVDYNKAQNLILTSVILIIGVSGAKVHIGAAELKGMALATIVGIGLSLLFKVISLFRKEEEVLDAPDESAEQK